MSTPKIYSERLREIRRAQGLTLKQVEIRSRGKWKGVVVGSYERGTRTLSVEKALSLCEFYGVPLDALFGSPKDKEPVDRSIPALDLRTLQSFSQVKDPFSIAVKRLTDSILLARGDWNGELISLRESDWSSLAMVLGITRGSVSSSLHNRNLFFDVKR